MKLVAWVGGAIVSVLIIASRKHYTVDIVIAWCARVQSHRNVAQRGYSIRYARMVEHSVLQAIPGTHCK